MFLKACRGEEVEYTPVWIMRQAGRYLPEYQEIRSRVDFLTLCKTPELAAEVTLQPVRILGVDAAILFSDILIPVQAMGMDLVFTENKGPVLNTPVRDDGDVSRLKLIKPEEDVPFVLETIKILVQALSNEVPLIGFSGAPFTVATYMIEGGSSKNFLTTKRMMYCNPSLFGRLMETITVSTIAYLTAQVKAGAQAIQLFDTWAGALSPSDYRTNAFPYVCRIIKAIKALDVPFIYFINDCAGLLDIATGSGADVLGIDWRLDMAEAVKKVAGKTALQGNLDPCLLFSTKEQITTAASLVLSGAKGAKGHIFNLGHGILPETPVDNVKALVDAVHESTAR